MQILVSQNDSRGKKEMQAEYYYGISAINQNVQLQCQIMCNDSL